MSGSGAGLLTRHARATWLHDVTPRAWKALALGGLGWMFDVYDNFMLALTIPALVVAFALSKAEAGAIGSILAAGLVLGGIGFGWVADRIGRVRTLMLCVTIYSLFSGATAFVNTVTELGLVRFLAGLGMGGAWTAGAALVAETWHPAHRGKGGALMQIGLPLGSMLAIAVVSVVNAVMGGLDGQGWKIVYLMGFLPILVIIPLGLLTPESPIWLERRRAVAVTERSREPVTAMGRSYFSKLTCAFGFIFFAQYIYWGVFTWTPSFLVSAKHFAFVRSLEFTMAQQIGSLLGFLVFASLVDRFGRRPAFLLYLAIGAGAVAWLVLGTTPLAIMAAMFLSGFGITGIFAGLGPLTAELAPPDAGRAFFMGLAYNGGRLGGILAPFLIGALATSDANFMLGMATAIPAFLFAAVILFTIPETKGLKLT